MQLTSLVLLAGALGASALPSNHAHLHREVHDKRGAVHFKAVHKTPTATPAAPTTTTTSTTPAAVKATSSTAAAAAATSSAASASSSSSSSSSSSGSYVSFCSGSSKREVVEYPADYPMSKRATTAQIAYTGNTGTSTNWGCNIMTVASNIASQYDYTITFTNVASDSYEVICWNKIGPTGLIDGWYGHKAVDFKLAAGQTQVVAFEANSQGSCGYAAGSVPTDQWGAWAGMWTEFDFANSGNQGYSGGDCSSLIAQNAGLSVPGCHMCGGSSPCSTILPGGTGTNAYTKGLEDADGIGINAAPGALNLAVSVGYSG